MQDRRTRPLAAKARPLVTRRDYELARKLVLRYVRQSEAERDWERTKALLREIAQYERSRKGEDAASVVIWAQGVGQLPASGALPGPISQKGLDEQALDPLRSAIVVEGQ